MKYSNTRRQLSAKMLKVRVPKDYPWVVLTHLCEFGRKSYPGTFEPLERIIRRRDLEGLESWIDSHGLQSINICGEYESPALPALLYQTAAVVKKYPMWSNPSDRIQTAMDGFKRAEDNCRQFNETKHSRMFSSSGDLHPIFRIAQGLIYTICGAVLPSSERLTYGSRHGPGSTSSLRREFSHLYYKYMRWPYSVTPGARLHARDLIVSDQRWIGALENSYREFFKVEPWKVLNQDLFWSRVLTEVPGNRITTVPKDGRKDRPIAMEPTMNIHLQLGVHDYIRRRLRRWGVDLEDQTTNRRLAFQASTSGSHCTIDLSSASDSVSLRLVEELFPPDWNRYLCSLRSPEGILPSGERLVYEKLSSMGNGYTFAVETLIFFAISAAVQIHLWGKYHRGTISVFGDDIIVPNELYHWTVHSLECAGFTVNTEKSFHSGCVRESCGIDCFNGYDINPVEIDRIPETVMDLYCDRNRLQYWFKTVFGINLPAKFDKFFLDLIPERFHLFGPEDDDVFDTHIHSDGRLESATIVSTIQGIKGCWKGWKYQSIQPIVPYSKPKDFFFGKLLASLRQFEEPKQMWRKATPKAGSCFEVPRTERIRYKVAACYSTVMRGAYKLDRSTSP